jgi:hypothetical protein
VKQSALILHGPIAATPDAGEWSLSLAGVLKGQAQGPQRLRIAANQDEPRRQLREWLGMPGAYAVLFASEPAEQGAKAFVHLSGQWIAAESAGPAAWNLVSPATTLDSTYAGGTDMLVKVARYIIEDPDADVPVSVGMAWRDWLPVTRVAEGVSGIAVMEIQGKRMLFIGSPGGDRLYALAATPDGRERMEERTSLVRLDTRSQSFLWLDMDADGASDLVSWDGAALSVRLMKKGQLQPAGATHALTLEAGCLGLSAAGLSPALRPRLLVSTPGVPRLVEWSAAEGWRSGDLPRPSSDASGGAASPCVVADLDSDGFADVLQPRERSGLLWRGTSDGFARPVASAVVSRGGRGCVALGDFDADGSLDVFVGSPNGNELWENDGRGLFRAVLANAGSLSYKADYRVSTALGTDLNHDGRPDLLLGAPEAGFVCHFSRGYRCFGEQGELRLSEVGDAPNVASWGVQAMAAGDLDGNNTEDLAVTLAGGEVHCYLSSLFRVYGANVRLPVGTIGPVTVSAWQKAELPVCTGTWSVCDPAQPVLFSVRSPGRCILRYQLPQGPAGLCYVLVGEDPPLVVLPSQFREGAAH